MSIQDWCWSWNSNTLATWWEELTHWKRPWCWERLTAGEGDDGGWDGWMASLTQWTWVWINSGSWWWTGRPGVLLSTGCQRVGRDWVTELIHWTDKQCHFCVYIQEILSHATTLMDLENIMLSRIITHTYTVLIHLYYLLQNDVNILNTTEHLKMVNIMYVFCGLLLFIYFWHTHTHNLPIHP